MKRGVLEKLFARALHPDLGVVVELCYRARLADASSPILSAS
jgi:hypothetical protein